MRDVRVPVRDGSWLAADLFMPVPRDERNPLPSQRSPHPSPLPEGEGEGSGERFPALLEYLPYRKDDGTAARWEVHHYFAARGYVGVRLDVRGTGNSPGVATGEYTPQEQLDGYDAIEWLATQPWCTGRVGMFGTSYGGFNAIQVATHRPPSLKAIVPHAATDDRYTDDMHYYGGCLPALDQLPYPLRMIAQGPLAPALRLPDWEAIWRDHQESPPWMLDWLRHQTRDAFWKQGSLREDYGAIACPVLSIGGWNDAYTNATLRLLEHLKVPRKGLVGPWTHGRPDGSFVGPKIDYLREVLRWWDHWLKDVDTGIMDEPLLAVYVQRSRPAARFPSDVPGEWRWETEWPPRRTQTAQLFLDKGRLSAEGSPAQAGAVEFDYDPTVGVMGGAWCPSTVPMGLAGEQSIDDARSLTFETHALDEPMEILGTSRLTLHVRSTAPVAFFVAKLCEVTEGGESRLITRGALNATRRSSLQEPEPLEQGETYELRIDLRVISWVTEVGSRLRLSISGADWPLIWPSPYPTRHTVLFGGTHASRLELPLVGPPEHTLPAPAFGPPPALPKTADSDSAGAAWNVIQDELDGAVTVEWAHRTTTRPHDPEGRQVVLDSEMEVRATTHRSDPARTEVRGRHAFRLTQDGVEARTEAHARIASDAETLHVEIDLDATVEGQEPFHREWRETIPRHLL